MPPRVQWSCVAGQGPPITTGGSRDAGGLDYTLERWIRQNDRMVLYGYYLYLRGR